MKTLILAFAFALTLTSSFAADERPSSNASEVTSSKNKSLFVFKTKKKFAGATVEIYASNGSMLTSQHLQKRKMIISFSDAQFDTYTIRIAKGNNTKEFQYIKK